MQFPEPISLWPDGAPLAQGKDTLDCPTIVTRQAPKELDTGCAVIVCPGGGYRILASDHEGWQVANELNRWGVSAYILKYRVGPKYPTTTSLLDAQRAIRWVRHHFNYHTVGMLGFSAGGHLTAATATAKGAASLNASDLIDQQDSVPSFQVPVYAVTNGELRGRKADEYFATDELVDAQTPPAFIVHTHEDSIVPATQSTLFYDALLSAGVPAELHVFNSGEHGVGLASGDLDVNVWPDLLRRWLVRQGFLTAKSRVKINASLNQFTDCTYGQVWVTFQPDNANQPSARVRTGRMSKGMIEIPEDQGVVPGTFTLSLTPVHDFDTYDASGEFSIDVPESTSSRVRVLETGVVELI